MAYTLPRGVVDVVLTVEPQKAKFNLTVDNLQFVPDPRHQYLLRYQPHPSYSDNITVETSPKSFLKVVKSDTTDRTPEVLYNVARALTVFGGFEAAPLSAEAEELFRVTLDPLDDDERVEAIKKINAAASNFIAKAKTSCSYFDTAGGPAFDPAQCKNQQRLRSSSDATVSDRALFTLNCELEVPNGLRDKLRSAEVSKRAIAAAIKRAEAELEDAGVGKIPPDFSCKREIQAGVSEGEARLQNLCGLLVEQASADAKVKRLQGEVDDREGKISTISTQRRDQAKWCRAFKNMKPVSAEISVSGYGPAAGTAAPASTRAPAPSAPDCSAGLCYRPKEPYRIMYGLRSGSGLLSRQVINVDLPSPTELIGIDITRAFFVQKVQEIQFDENGSLSTVKINKPSELLAVSKLPLSVIEAVAGGLAVRVETINSQRDHVLKQAKLLEAQAKLEEAQAQYESAPLRTESAPVRARARKPASASTLDALR